MIDGAAKRVVRPNLKDVVTEASQALARLDGARLEELALSCAALNREMTRVEPDDKEQLVRGARAAVREMAVFARVLEATRANIRVMHRLQELRLGRLEYSERPELASGSGAAKTGEASGHGDD